MGGKGRILINGMGSALICLVLIWYETIDYTCNLKVLEIVIG